MNQIIQFWHRFTAYLAHLGQIIAAYFYSDTELAIWVSIGIFAILIVALALTLQGFRRFITVVLVISAVLIALMVKFGPPAT